jgi:hypothetical protein
MSDIFPTLNGSETIGRTLCFHWRIAVDGYHLENGPVVSPDGRFFGLAAGALTTM